MKFLNLNVPTLFLLAGLAFTLPAVASDAEPGCCESNVVAELGFAASETGPFLSFADADRVFYAASDLETVGADLATVANPFTDRPVTVQLRAVGADAQAQSFAVELAPGDSARLGLPPWAVRLVASSVEAFDLELEDLATGSTVRPGLKAARTGRNPRTNEPSTVDLTKATQCQGPWTLTCLSGGCSGLGPFTHDGRVETETIYIGPRPKTLHKVYWNLNTPTGDYKTKNPDGLTATWDPGSGVCPVEVTNSLGHTYTVTR